MLISLPAAVVADANVLLSALIGGRARLVLTSPTGPRCIAPVAVAEEIAEHLPTLAARRGLALDLLLAAFRVMPVEWQGLEVYEPLRAEALRRIAARDIDDWPTVALALLHGVPIWSQDKDLLVSGLPIYTTGDLLQVLGLEGD